MGYISNAANGIDAINLLAGESIWRTDIASKPLIVYMSRLVALRQISKRGNLFQITALDLNAEGSLVLKSEPVALPDWVDINGNDDDFALEVFLDQGVLALNWEAHLRYEGGAPPPRRSPFSVHTGCQRGRPS